MFNESQHHYIDGHWVEGKGTRLRSYDPANQALIWEGRMANAEEVQKAVGSAKKASTTWAALAFEERLAFAEKFVNIVQQKSKILNELISLETGKPLWESATETQSVIAKVRLSADAYRERNAEKKTAQADMNACLRYKPHGVLAVLGAFNFPAHLSNGHIVPALLAGNAIVYKPSELTPMVGAFIMQCWHETGILPGAINALQGDKTTAQHLLHSDIQGLCFTGSYATGKAIHQYFAGRPEIILALEMGGNNPLIVDENLENLPAAVYATILSAFITAGQRCTAARRLLVPKGPSGDRFLKALLEASEALSIGSFRDSPEPFMGPVISLEQALKHLEAQDSLLKTGGKDLLGMKQIKPGSAFLSPGLIDMTQASHPKDEEIFAPLLQIYRYHTFDEAIALANSTRYGLSAGLLSDKQAHYEKFYHRIRAGLINWNKPTTGALGSLPFGGIGCSGNHRPSAYFASDYCAYPIASLENASLHLPEALLAPLKGLF